MGVRRLFRCLTNVAATPELHTFPRLGGLEPVRLNRVRCELLLDEFAFAADRFNDPLATGLPSNCGLRRRPYKAAGAGGRGHLRRRLSKTSSLAAAGHAQRGAGLGHRSGSPGWLARPRAGSPP
jgi:hypothetical protein